MLPGEPARRGSWKLVVDNGKQVNRVEQAREEAAALRGLLRRSEEEVKARGCRAFTS